MYPSLWAQGPVFWSFLRFLVSHMTFGPQVASNLPPTRSPCQNLEPTHSPEPLSWRTLKVGKLRGPCAVCVDAILETNLEAISSAGAGLVVGTIPGHLTDEIMYLMQEHLVFVLTGWLGCL